MNRIRLATAWLDGCSGCHMSFLDLDERLIELATDVDLVYSPLVDVKQYPSDVDACLVEGAVGTEEDLARIRLIRERTGALIALGDCAVTTNVPGLRNPIGTEPLLRRAYRDTAAIGCAVPDRHVPRLLPEVLPVHRVVPVDCFLPGCPPPAELIWQVLAGLRTGTLPDLAGLARFGG